MAQINQKQTKPIFVYWALRGKPHLIRLIINHFKIDHQEIIFKSPKVWEIQGKPIYKDLPCFKHEDNQIHQVIPILIYLCKKFGHSDLLGKTTQHQAHVEMYLWSMDVFFKKIIAFNGKEAKTVQELMKNKQELWKKEIQKKLKQLQQFPLFDEYYLGYLSVVDFDIYELVNYLRILFPNKASQYPKLNQLQKRISNLPGIKQYSNSENGQSLCYLPVQMIKKFKSQQSQSGTKST